MRRRGRGCSRGIFAEGFCTASFLRTLREKVAATATVARAPPVHGVPCGMGVAGRTALISDGWRPPAVGPRRDASAFSNIWIASVDSWGLWL